MKFLWRCQYWRIGQLRHLSIVVTVTGMISIVILFQNLCRPKGCPNIPHLSSSEDPDNDSDDGQECPSKMETTEERSCQPHTHIFFLKTHKTASSTIMNILLRFGESRNLTFALPINNHTQFFYPNNFRAYFVEDFVGRISPHYDIMCHHMRFQLTEVERVMPQDTFYFSIIRNPVSLMESIYSYYKGIDIFIKAKSLEDYLRNPYRYYNQASVYHSYGKNLMAFDFGFNPVSTETPKQFELAKKTIDVMFNLILIAEYFDESLILLKDALCWSYDDVLSFPLNSRDATSRKDLSEETQENIKIWNQLDWQLYVYFNKSFWEKVDTFGRDRMQREVQELRRRRAVHSEICLQGQVDSSKIKDNFLKPYQTGLSKILGYNLKPGLKKAESLLCHRLVTPELQYTGLLYNKQNRNETIQYFKIPKLIIHTRGPKLRERIQP